MKKVKKTFRQGDILIVAVAGIPEGAKPVIPGPRGYVLAEGEATGHAHIIEPSSAVKMQSLAEQLFLQVAEPVTVTHEEHGWIMLPEGNYKVVRQVEYSPEELRQVTD